MDHPKRLVPGTLRIALMKIILLMNMTTSCYWLFEVVMDEPVAEQKWS